MLSYGTRFGRQGALTSCGAALGSPKPVGLTVSSETHLVGECVVSHILHNTDGFLCLRNEFIFGFLDFLLRFRTKLLLLVLFASGSALSSELERGSFCMGLDSIKG